jgi:hypothetical protein
MPQHPDKQLYLLRKTGEQVGHHHRPRVQHWCDRRSCGCDKGEKMSSGKEYETISSHNVNVQVFHIVHHLSLFGMFRKGTNILC